MPQKKPFRGIFTYAWTTNDTIENHHPPAHHPTRLVVFFANFTLCHNRRKFPNNTKLQVHLCLFVICYLFIYLFIYYCLLRHRMYVEFDVFLTRNIRNIRPKQSTGIISVIIVKSYQLPLRLHRSAMTKSIEGYQ